MSQSLTKLLIHIIFSTKHRYPFFRDNQARAEIFRYLGGICNNSGSQVLSIGGYEDHVHIFCIFSKNESISRFIMEMKKQSSKWVKERDFHLSKFEWQNGYGAFSVSQSQCEAVIDYIMNQEQHHKKRTFQEEFKEMLIRYKINFNEKYLWEE